MSDQMLGYVVVFGTFIAFLWIAYATRAKVADDFYVAGRRVHPIWNGMAIGADWMSAASFISMAGALAALGYDGLAFIMGWTGGYVLLTLVIAPYLRKFGKYTASDFVGDRYESHVARVVSVVCAITISLCYCIAQVAGAGLIMSRLMGFSMNVAIFIAIVIVVASTVMGGMKSITFTQCAQYIVLIIGYLIPITAICFQMYGHPFSQLAYGDVLAKIVAKEQELGFKTLYIEPFTKMNAVDMWVLTLILMIGTAGLPHIMMRYFTVPTVRDARYSSGWALIAIGALYISAPAYAAFQKYTILYKIVGEKIAEMPAWVTAWGKAGLITIKDANADGILQYAELSIHRDVVVLSMPEIANLPYFVSAIVAAGGLAAAISTADGLLMVISSAFSHDIYYRIINPNASEKSRVILGKSLIGVSACVAGVIAAQNIGFIVQIVAWAFSLAAATFFPVIVMGLFYKRTNKEGAITGMILGLLITIYYIGAVKFGWPHKLSPVFGIKDMGAGLFGMTANFLCCAIISQFTPPPSEKTMEMVDHCRYPVKLSSDFDSFH
ncbi:MAG: cation acetate symporter [Desulfuromonadaceae bacterium]|nr:cation acetate symporter [Desulfuromonadaceae bacterium]